jgi:hypothetical protein
MNNVREIIANVDSKSGKHLLHSISEIRAEVGDRLNEDEFTRLLRQTELPNESGFAFLSFCDRFVMLSVPQQELANWYQEKGRIVPAKEKIARAIGDKYALTVCEPPDMFYPCLNSSNPHHHLEFSNHQETIFIVHPRFLKVRLFVATSLTHDAQTAHRLLDLGSSLLEDLSTLYKA